MTTTPRTHLRALLDRSRAIITSLQEPNGAYPASPTFSAYRGYCWLRDGAFIADGVSAAGEVTSASAFFDWCSTVLLRHEGRIHAILAAAKAGTPLPNEQMLPARFTFDGGLGEHDWWDFQLDGYGTWMWAASEHARRHDLDTGRWRRAAELTVDYLLSSWERPCYDWWEEHDEHVHISTLGCVAAGLRGAADGGLVDGDRAVRARTTADRVLSTITERGLHEGHLVKWIGAKTVDASLSALVSPLGLIAPDSELGMRTLDAVEQDLCVDDGVHRFLADTFYGGGRWPLLSCFLGLGRAAQGNQERAYALLEWASSTATDEGDLPEQVDGHLLAPERRAEWLARWGEVATPLLWSHAMLLRLTVELGPTAKLGEDISEEQA